MRDKVILILTLSYFLFMVACNSSNKDSATSDNAETGEIIINFVEAAEVTQARLTNNNDILTDEEAKKLEQQIKDDKLKLQEIEKQIEALEAAQTNKYLNKQ